MSKIDVVEPDATTQRICDIADECSERWINELKEKLSAAGIDKHAANKAEEALTILSGFQLGVELTYRHFRKMRQGLLDILTMYNHRVPRVEKKE